jgi:hypothetical protein
MARKLDDKELVHPHELMMSNVIQIDAIAQLLIEKTTKNPLDFWLNFDLPDSR